MRGAVRVGATAEEEAWSPRGLGNLDPGRNCRIPWASGLARPGPWGGGTGPLPCLLNLFIDLGVRRGSRRGGGDCGGIKYGKRDSCSKFAWIEL